MFIYTPLIFEERGSDLERKCLCDFILSIFCLDFSDPYADELFLRPLIEIKVFLGTSFGVDRFSCMR